jgi:hypothetical protein
MPIIKVWCLPKQTEDELNHLHKSIVEAVVSITELGLKDKNQMTCLFVPDLMSYGLGQEIVIEIGGLYEKPERTDEVKRRLAESVGKNVKNIYQNARVECFVTSFDPKRGFWKSD